MPFLPACLLATCLMVGGTEPPAWRGDPEGPDHLQTILDATLDATEAFGPMPRKGWSIRLHEDDLAFEGATGAPGKRAAVWIGDELHLRPWTRLRRRNVGALLRHELVHRRSRALGLRPWAEESRALWAESHPRPPVRWPGPPAQNIQDRLDLALNRGTTASQAWAYRALRAWLEGRPVPRPPAPPTAPGPADGWKPSEGPTSASASR